MSKNSSINESVFFPELEKICDMMDNSNFPNNFPSVFIPHIMPKYEKAEKKIFYFGRDTYGWIPKNELLEYYKSKDLEGFVNQTKINFIHDYGFLEYNNNAAAGFWTLALRLHLKIKGINDKLPISDNFPNDKLYLISDFGYGNTNCIELEQTLKKWGKDETKGINSIWETINKAEYNTIKLASRKLDKLKYTIEAYKPDLVFIFNWQCNEIDFLEGLEYVEQKHELIGGKFWTYFLPETNTHVIWTLHPNSIRFTGMNVDDLIEVIINYLHENKILEINQ